MFRHISAPHVDTLLLELEWALQGSGSGESAIPESKLCKGLDKKFAKRDRFENELLDGADL